MDKLNSLPNVQDLEEEEEENESVMVIFDEFAEINFL